MKKAALCAAIMAASTQLLLTAVAAAHATGAPEAPPVMPIAPQQLFTGLVNPGPVPVAVSSSNSPAIIRMACFGPEPVGGRMGHPLPGQSTAVTRAFAVTSAALPGFTGLADSIDATVYFPFPSPVVEPPVSGVHLALFNYYDVPAPISTEVELPCSGTGVVVFNPVLGGPTARPSDVTVYFVGQP